MCTLQKKTITNLLLLSLVATQLAGCSIILSSSGAGAAFGALTGGLIVGNYIDQQNATRAEAAKTHRYDARSDMLEIESSTVSPQAVAQSQSFEATVQYTVLTPDSSAKIMITETRSLEAGQNSFDLGRREVAHAQGTHTSIVKITVPRDLPKGDYTLATTISDGKTTKTAKNNLSVR